MVRPTTSSYADQPIRPIAAAALDVFPNEPRVSTDILDMANVILEPHIASTTVEHPPRRKCV